jgi:hypothetical protein
MRFFINNFIILRQNIANMIIWYALLSGFGLIIVIISVYLAAQFHVTAYANIVTGCIYKWIEKIDIRKIYIVTMIISFVLLFSSTSTINNIINNFISFAGEKYTKYIISDEYVVGFNEIYYLLRIAFFGLFYWTYDTLEESNKKSLFCISAIAVILGSINVDIFSRFMEFYMIGIYAFMAISYKAFRRESQKYYLIILYLAMMVIMIRQLNIYGDGHLLNYKLFFGE